MIQITGGSIGYQVGVQSTDLDPGVSHAAKRANLLNGTLKVGVDASAAAGPVGRQSSAATDLQLQAEILSYSRARGAFIGVSIDGSFDFARSGRRSGLLPAAGSVPASAVQLLQYLTAYSGGSAAPNSPPAAVPTAAASAPPAGPPSAPAQLPWRQCRPCRKRRTKSKRRVSNSMPPRVNSRPMSTTTGKSTSPCRRKSTSRINRRTHRCCSRRSLGTRKCRGTRIRGPADPPRIPSNP